MNLLTPEQELTEIATTVALRMEACKSRARLELLGLLLAGPSDVTTLARRLDLDLPSISHNLRGLRESGLVVCDRDRTRKLHTLSKAIQVQQRGGFVEMWIGVPAQGQWMYPLPLTLAHRLDARRAEHGPSSVTVRPIGGLPRGERTDPHTPQHSE